MSLVYILVVRQSKLTIFWLRFCLSSGWTPATGRKKSDNSKTQAVVKIIHPFQGRKNGGKCYTKCEGGWLKPGRDFPITCRCMRTNKGIKCNFNENPTLCERDGTNQRLPDGRLLIKPTQRTTTKAPGRQIFYPNGQKPTKKTKPQRKKPANVNIGGFENLSTIERNGVPYNSENQGNVNIDIQTQLQNQLAALQLAQEQLILAATAPKAPPGNGLNYKKMFNGLFDGGHGLGAL